MLAKVKVVLVGTSHPGNIGSAARAMKTMGLSQLVLVAPLCENDEKSVALAAGAADVLANAIIVDTLEEAVAECGLVIGTSARSRTLQWPMLDSREAGLKLIEEVPNYPVALVFGRERIGLTNDELQKCTYHVCVSANPEYSSLNLAMAVQILTYETRMAYLATNAYPAQDNPYPKQAELEMFHTHLEETLWDTGFINKAHPGQVMNRLRRLFTRARPEAVELNILRGALVSIQRRDSKK